MEPLDAFADLLALQKLRLRSRPSSTGHAPVRIPLLGEDEPTGSGLVGGLVAPQSIMSFQDDISNRVAYANWLNSLPRREQRRRITDPVHLANTREFFGII